MNLKKYFKLHYWPLLTAIWLMSTVLITFTLAVLQKHVYIYFPYISDTGTIPPESCIFGQLLSVSVMMLLVTVYIRYRLVGFMIKYHKDVKVAKIWNTLGGWCGILICVGVSVVANFQETNALHVHTIGAGMTFGFGSVYLCIQTLISYLFRQSYYKHPSYGIGPKLLCFRVVSSIVCTILSGVAMITFTISYSQFTGESMEWWTEEHGGFQIRLIASFSEWIVGIFLLAYVATLTNEFKVMEYEEVRFRYNFLNNDETDEDVTKINDYIPSTSI